MLFNRDWREFCMDAYHIRFFEMKRGSRPMSTHDKNLVLMMCFAAALVSLNFFAVVTGLADGYYEQITEMLEPILLGRSQAPFQ